MLRDAALEPEDCNCFAMRSAARHVTQFYDHQLAPIGLRTTQFSILAKLKRLGPLTINGLAKAMLMDRTIRRAMFVDAKPNQEYRLDRRRVKAEEIERRDSVADQFSSAAAEPNPAVPK